MHKGQLKELFSQYGINLKAKDIALPNREFLVLYGRPTFNYGEQLSLYVPHMLRVNMTRDLAHLQLSDLQEEIRPICRTSELQDERILIRRT